MNKNILLLSSLVILSFSCSKSKTDVKIKKVTSKIDSTNITETHAEKAPNYHSYIYKSEEIAKIPPEILNKIPQDYLILDVVSGFLNDDKFKDYIIAIKEKEEYIDEDGNAPKRKLIIFVGKEDGSFEITRVNDKNVIYGLDYGTNLTDPFLGLKILPNKNILIEHGVASGNAHWSQFYEFKYDKKLNNWILIRNEMTSYSENYEKGLKFDKEYGLQIRKHTLKTPKDFGLQTIDGFEEE